ncbi:TPA: Cof-type HAD-IIB family hydrolase [Streptococcus agalactiae]
MVRLIFSDIDGTLINSNFKVTPKARQGIKQIVAQGATFVPISARMPEAITPIMEQIGIDSYIISYNGALIQDMQQKTIASHTMDGQVALQVCSYVSKHYSKIAWNVYRYHEWYSCDKENEWVQKEEEIVGLQSKEMSLMELEKQDRIHKLLLMGEPSLMGELENTLKAQYPHLSIAQSAPYFIEIMAPGIEKGKSAKTLADYLDISLADSIAFGDNYNDLNLLEIVGKGFVMANAPKDLQERIGNVTQDNDNDGIYYALVEYMEN